MPTYYVQYQTADDLATAAAYVANPTDTGWDDVDHDISVGIDGEVPKDFMTVNADGTVTSNYTYNSTSEELEPIT